MAVMKASRGVTKPRRPHNEAMVSSAFRMLSVAVSSVLKGKDKREWRSRRQKRVGSTFYRTSYCIPLLANTEVLITKLMPSVLLLVFLISVL